MVFKCSPSHVAIQDIATFWHHPKLHIAARELPENLLTNYFQIFVNCLFWDLRDIEFSDIPIFPSIHAVVQHSWTSMKRKITIFEAWVVLVDKKLFCHVLGHVCWCWQAIWASNFCKIGLYLNSTLGNTVNTKHACKTFKVFMYLTPPQ